ncbi:hypothetical protein [Paenibacillus beijingensis]|uniref:Uncharacterized protein n=1 Tax=Paenibacillus beijingensis TaxID=1126833 RepID=A0A0D5NLR6_9BACL|nr:hypothetical protein [Paenibacillus beijingensis]AJY76264.1 hypothetical protein VN24_18985 [Paenibacillus beijingensis]
MNQKNKIQFGLAMVTPKGLLFNNKFYSNQAMIKSKWFELSEREGNWHVPVLYSPAFPTKLFLFDMNSIEVATAIEHTSSISKEEVETYFQVMSNLKELFVEQKKGEDK